MSSSIEAVRPRAGIRAWAVAQVVAWADGLHEPEERAARSAGLCVERTGWHGTARTYRDPRFGARRVGGGVR